MCPGGWLYKKAVKGVGVGVFGLWFVLMSVVEKGGERREERR